VLSPIKQINDQGTCEKNCFSEQRTRVLKSTHYHWVTLCLITTTQWVTFDSELTTQHAMEALHGRDVGLHTRTRHVLSGQQ
jgi:hypothetical protein